MQHLMAKRLLQRNIREDVVDVLKDCEKYKRQSKRGSMAHEERLRYSQIESNPPKAVNW